MSAASILKSTSPAREPRKAKSAPATMAVAPPAPDFQAEREQTRAGSTGLDRFSEPVQRGARAFMAAARSIHPVPMTPEREIDYPALLAAFVPACAAMLHQDEPGRAGFLLALAEFIGDVSDGAIPIIDAWEPLDMMPVEVGERLAREMTNDLRPAPEHAAANDLVALPAASRTTRQTNATTAVPRDTVASRLINNEGGMHLSATAARILVAARTEISDWLDELRDTRPNDMDVWTALLPAKFKRMSDVNGLLFSIGESSESDETLINAAAELGIDLELVGVVL